MILLLIALDFYLLPTSWVQEKVAQQALENNRTSITRSYKSYTVISEKGHKYNLPEGLNGWLKPDSDFVIGKTAILGCPASIYFQTNGEEYSMQIGNFNSNSIVQVFLIVVLITSILQLVRKDVSSNLRNKFLAI